MIERIFYFIFEISIVVSIVIIFTLILLHFDRNHLRLEWRKILWIVLAIRLLIPYNYSLPVFNEIFQKSIGKEDVIHLIISNNSDKKTGTDNQNQDVPNYKWDDIFAAIKTVWLFGSASYFILHFGQYTIFRINCRKKMKIINDTKMEEYIRKVLKGYGKKKELPVYTCEGITSPLITGFFNTVLLLPNNQYNEEELHMIVKHECCHYANNDLWFKLIISIAAGIHWFNPIVHMMANQAFKDIELLCDSNVVIGMDKQKRADYSKMILECGKISNNTIYSTCFVKDKHILKQRIANIFDNSRKKKGILPLIFMLLLLIFSCMLIPCNNKTNKENEGINAVNQQLINENPEFETNSSLQVSINENGTEKYKGSCSGIPCSYYEEYP